MLSPVWVSGQEVTVRCPGEQSRIRVTINSSRNNTVAYYRLSFAATACFLSRHPEQIIGSPAKIELRFFRSVSTDVLRLRPPHPKSPKARKGMSRPRLGCSRPTYFATLFGALYHSGKYTGFPKGVSASPSKNSTLVRSLA